MRTKIKVAIAAAVGVAALGGQVGIASAATTTAKKKHSTVKHQSNSSTSTSGSTSVSDPGSTDVSGTGTAKKCDGHGRGHGRHGHHGGGRGNETALTGDTKTSAESAALAAVPGGTVRSSSTEDPDEGTGAAYEVHVTKSDGSEVEVLEDSSFKVLSVKAGGRGGHGGPQDDQSGDSSDTSGSTQVNRTRA